MMTKDIINKFINFFKQKNHQYKPSSSLTPTNDPSVLLTTAGMQQFKEYFSGKKQPSHKRVISIQKCFRTSDIDQVGDETHLTFFEMLGNFSFGDYFKSEAINWAWDFLTQELEIDRERISANYFGGDQDLVSDDESLQFLLKAGFKNIKKLGKADTFWGPTGDEGSCGPAVEINVDGIEIWTLVFNEFYQNKDGRLRPLLEKGVDTGLGLERLKAVLECRKDVFATDIFTPVIKKVEEVISIKYEKARREFRIISDHIRGICFLISDGVLPSNIGRGYVLRRLIRRAQVAGFLLNRANFNLQVLVEETIKNYIERYPALDQDMIKKVLKEEEKKFQITFDRGMKKLEKNLKDIQDIIPGDLAFMLYDSFGFPIEVLQVIAEKQKLKVDLVKFNQLMTEQKQRARKAGEEKKKHMANLDADAVKNHTAAHLLHQALREVLGSHIRQAGQDLSADRLRFDFTHPRPLSDGEKEKIETIVNQKIRDALPVIHIKTTVKEAKKQGAVALFKEKYGEKVTMYKIGNYSKELCAGPHVGNTSEIGSFKIIKEQSSGAGVRRIKAVTGDNFK